MSVRLSLITLGMLLVAGCGQKAEQTGQAARGGAPAAEQKAAPVPGGEIQSASVKLTGTLGCGHCTFHTTSECAIAMKTDDGRIVVIEPKEGEEKDHLFAERMSGRPVEAEGRLEQTNGQNVLHAERVEIR